MPFNKYNPLKIFFFGAPRFSTEILAYLINNNISISGVVTHPNQPVGRKKILTPTPIKTLAIQKQIPVKEFHKLDNTALNFFQKEKPDLFIVASYGTIIPQEILDIPKLGALNVHPSLLPKLRGASPIQTALQQGLNQTGSTIMLMDAGMDTGNIIRQQKTTIKPTEKYPELEQKLANISNQLLLPIVRQIITTKEKPIGKPQDNTQASYTKLIKKKDGLINWNKPAQEIYNQWRAFYEWPQSYSYYKQQKIIFTELEIYQAQKFRLSKPQPGKINKSSQEEILIETAQGYLKINRLQLAGKKEMSIQDFINGHPDFLQTNLQTK